MTDVLEDFVQHDWFACALRISNTRRFVCLPATTGRVCPPAERHQAHSKLCESISIQSVKGTSGGEHVVSEGTRIGYFAQHQLDLLNPEVSKKTSTKQASKKQQRQEQARTKTEIEALEWSWLEASEALKTQTNEDPVPC